MAIALFDIITDGLLHSAGTELWAVTIREEKGRFWRPVRDAFLREASPGRLPQDVFRLPRGFQGHIPY